MFKVGNPFSFSNLEKEIQLGLRGQEHGLKRHGGRLYASNVHSCYRSAVLYCSVSEERKSSSGPASSAYMKIGVALEDLVEASLEKRGWLLASQWRVNQLERFNVGGKVDFIILDPADKKIRLVEMKTCGKLPSRPKSGHAKQALVYEAISGVESSILYFSRSVADFSGSLKIRNLPLNATHYEIQDALRSIAIAHRFIANEALPPIPPHKSSPKDCKFCPFVSFCWSGEQEWFTHNDWPEDAKVSQRLLDLAEQDVQELWASRSERTELFLQKLYETGTDRAKELLEPYSKSGDWALGVSQLVSTTSQVVEGVPNA